MISKDDFKTVPDEQDIAGIERDLRFHPADLERPLEVLDDQQLGGPNPRHQREQGCRLVEGRIRDLRPQKH